MLMRNPHYKTVDEQETDPTRESYSPREMLLGQLVVLLVLVIAILLRDFVV